jgi:hypothetical protein
MTGAAASSIFQVQALIPAGPSRTRRNAGEPAIPAARDQAAVFMTADVDRTATPRGRRPFPTPAIRTRRSGLGIQGYSDRAACKPSHTVQTVIGTEAAPRECRPARRLTAASISIGRGPTA